jgi:uncharacterized membrane protein YedE/YeeE
MHNFTPIASLLGGMLIGLSAAGLMFLNGRIAGISGIVAGAVRPEPGEWGWRACFIAGMVGAGVVARLVSPPSLAIGITRPIIIFLIAGLVVGFGTRLGSGCTSGHGVCGLSRGSARSLAATLSFMLAGVVTVYLTNHLFGGLP